MSTQHTRTPTPLSQAEFQALFIERYKANFGELPSRKTAELLMALLNHENGHGRAIHNHNWGNHVAGSSSDYYLPLWWHLDAPNLPEDTAEERAFKQRMLEHRAPGFKAPSKFRHRFSHEDGANAWFRLLEKETHQRIHEAAKRGDVVAFHKAIAFPHPRTKMAYCPHCKSDAVREQYRSLRDDLHDSEVFAHLPKGRPPEEGEVEGSEPSRPSLPPGSPLLFSRISGAKVETVRIGSQGLAVLVAQALLKYRAAPDLVLDGRFGPKCYHATQRFQDAQELQVDGTVGPKTWVRLSCPVEN